MHVRAGVFVRCKYCAGNQTRILHLNFSGPFLCIFWIFVQIICLYGRHERSTLACATRCLVSKAAGQSENSSALCTKTTSLLQRSWLVSKLTRGTCWKGFVSKIGFAEVKHFCRANLNFALVDGRDPYSRRYERLISLDRAANTSQLTVCHRIDGPDCRLMRLCCGIARYILRCGARQPNASISATVGISCQFAMI